jgi:hypothetical protein
LVSAPAAGDKTMLKVKLVEVSNAWDMGGAWLALPQTTGEPVGELICEFRAFRLAISLMPNRGL